MEENKNLFDKQAESAEPDYVEEIVGDSKPKNQEVTEQRPTKAKSEETVKVKKKIDPSVLIGIAIGAVVLVTVLIVILFGGKGNGGAFGGGSSEPEHTHSFGKWKTVEKATCAVEGRQERSCECGEVETKAINKTDDHDFGSWETTKKATCAKDGEKERECDICGETETKTIKASGEHSFVYNGRVTYCTEYGSSDSQKCEKCGYIELTGYTLSPTGHHESGLIIDRQPTAGREGVGHTECTSCGERMSTVSIPYTNIGDFNIESYGDGTYSIMDYWGSSSYVVIPAYTSDGYPITRIDGYAFYDKDYITTVIIPEGVEIIMDNAFNDCNGLTTVSLPGSLETIEQYAFYNCSSLTQINLPEGLTDIAYMAFAYCTALESIEIPYTVTSLYYAFYHCTALKTVTLPRSIFVYDYSFYNCYSITDVYYGGTEYDWNNGYIYINSYGNGYLKNATIHYS